MKLSRTAQGAKWKCRWKKCVSSEREYIEKNKDQYSVKKLPRTVWSKTKCVSVGCGCQFCHKFNVLRFLLFEYKHDKIGNYSLKRFKLLFQIFYPIIPLSILSFIIKNKFSFYFEPSPNNNNLHLNLSYVTKVRLIKWKSEVQINLSKLIKTDYCLLIHINL